jgi:hypothetical protein
MKVIMTDNIGLGIPSNIATKILELKAMVDAYNSIEVTLTIEIIKPVLKFGYPFDK